VTSASQLATALATAEQEPERLTLIEVVVDRLDVPPLLSTLAAAASAANSRVAK
jgi:indolepyruvate decarboxylase